MGRFRSLLVLFALAGCVWTAGVDGFGTPMSVARRGGGFLGFVAELPIGRARLSSVPIRRRLACVCSAKGQQEKGVAGGGGKKKEEKMGGPPGSPTWRKNAIRVLETLLRGGGSITSEGDGVRSGNTKGLKKNGPGGTGLWTDSKTSLKRREFSEAVQAAGLPPDMTPEDVENIFDKLDEDMNGEVTLNEMLEGWKWVQAELVEESESAAETQVLSRPSAPGADVTRALYRRPEGVLQPRAGRDPSRAGELAAAPKNSWDRVCVALLANTQYLTDEERSAFFSLVKMTGLSLLGPEEGDGKAASKHQQAEFDKAASIGGILADMQADLETLSAAVLRPVVKAGIVDMKQVTEAAGPVVTGILEDANWLATLPDKFYAVDDDSSRLVREYMVAASRDHRAVKLRLADGLYTLRNAGSAPLYEQHLLALESLQVYSPLAHAMGLGKLLWEFEDTSFRTLFPESYKQIEEWQLSLWQDSEGMMETAKEAVLDALNRNEYLQKHAGRYAISSRRKSAFSTFKKMFRDHKRREDVLDVFAMRVVIGLKNDYRDIDEVQVKSCTEAYASVRAALGDWREPKGRYKDYVTQPKANGYQSIHTTLECPKDLPLEIQIRTEEMHVAAEFGNAAHNLYKGGIKSTSAAKRFAELVRRDNVAVMEAPTEPTELKTPILTERNQGDGICLTAPSVCEEEEGGEEAWLGQGLGQDLIQNCELGDGEEESEILSLAINEDETIGDEIRRPEEDLEALRREAETIMSSMEKMRELLVLEESRGLQAL